MKRISIIFLIFILLCGIIFFSYLIGHRHGVINADKRSISMELSVYETLNAEGPDAAITMLRHILNFRLNSVRSDISLISDWNFWRKVRINDDMRNDYQIQIKNYSDQLPKISPDENSQKKANQFESEQHAHGDAEESE